MGGVSKRAGAAPGERWAYRASPHAGAVSEVEVLKVGMQRPPRVKVRFAAEEAEGLEEWVSPARLRVRWENCEQWLAREERWNELISDSPDDEDAQLIAAGWVLEYCHLDGTVSMGQNLRERGLLYVDDVPALAALLEVPEGFFTADPRAFTDTDGSVTAPWPTTLEVAPRLAAAHAEQLVVLLDQEEEREQQRAIYGQYYPGRGRSEGTFVSAEICAEVDRRYRPGRDLIRTWCGAETVEQFAELKALRMEVARIGKLTEVAIQALREAGQRATADNLEHKLGVPLELLRRTPDPNTAP